MTSDFGSLFGFGRGSFGLSLIPLFIGVAMPTVFYILWGVMEIATLPIAP